MKDIKIEYLPPPSNSYRLCKILKELDAAFQPRLSARVDIEQYARKLSENAELFYVVADGEDAANCAVYMNRDKAAFISSFAVKRGMQRMGIGRTLMRAVISEGRRKGVEVIGLDVHECNTSGIHFYLSQKFEKINQCGQWITMSRKI